MARPLRHQHEYAGEEEGLVNEASVPGLWFSLSDGVSALGNEHYIRTRAPAGELFVGHHAAGGPPNNTIVWGEREHKENNAIRCEDGNLFYLQDK